MEAPREAITNLLIRFGEGDRAASDQLLDAVYGELRRLARRNRFRWQGPDTPSETSLVHEAYLRLVDDDRISWQNRAQFFHLASLAMKNVLIDGARRRKRLKRGGEQRDLSLDDGDEGWMVESSVADADEILAVDQALERLRDSNERLADIIVCRIFGGLTVEETAKALGVSTPTVKRGYALARSWLYRELGDAPKEELDAQEPGEEEPGNRG